MDTKETSMCRDRTPYEQSKEYKQICGKICYFQAINPVLSVVSNVTFVPDAKVR